MKKGFNLLDLSVSLAVGALVLTVDQSVKIKEAQRQQARNVGIEMYRFASAVTEYLHTDPRGILNPGTNITFNGSSFLKRQGCDGAGSHSDGSTLAFLPCDFPDISTYGNLQFGLTIDVDAGGTVTASRDLGDFQVAGNPEPLLASLSSFTASTFGGNTLRSGDFYIGLYSYLADYQFVPGSANIALRVEQTTSNNEALLVNGANTMNSNITFNDTLPATQRGINNISSLTSLAGGTGIIEIFSANFSVSAGGGVSAAGDIASDGNLSASDDVTAGNNIAAGNDATVGNNLAVANDANVGGDIRSLGDLHSSNLFTGRLIDSDNLSQSFFVDPDLNSELNIISAERTSTKTITVTEDVNLGSSCLPKQIGTTSSGELASCVGGRWAQPKAAPTYTTRVSRLSYGGSARVFCRSDEQLVGGSCYATDHCGGNDYSGYGAYYANNGVYCRPWHCNRSRAYAICAK